MRLVDFPFVLGGFRCDLCKRSGRPRLARLADKYGCMTTFDDLVERITRDCPWRREGAADLKECGIYLPDHPPKSPPDLPRRPLRLVAGGKRR